MNKAKPLGSGWLRWFGKHLISRFFNRLYRVRIAGSELVPQEGPFLLVANHQHLLDPIVIQKHVHPWVHWVAKAELFRFAPLAATIRGLGAVSFDRERVDVPALRQLVQIVQNQGVIGIFPQGRRVSEEEWDRVLPKAATAHLARRFQLPVVPLALDNGFHLLGPRPTLTFGAPYYIAPDQGDEAATLEMMRRVYALMGKDYKLTLEVRA